MNWSIPVTSPTKKFQEADGLDDRFGDMSDAELDSELLNVGLSTQGSRYERELRLRNLYSKTGKNKGKKNDKTLSQIEMIAKKREERRAKMETKVA